MLSNYLIWMAKFVRAKSIRPPRRSEWESKLKNDEKKKLWLGG